MIFNLLGLLAAILVFRYQVDASPIYAGAAAITAVYFCIALVVEAADKITEVA